jgi:WD40 repeat protein
LATASGNVTALQADKVTVKVWRCSDGMEVTSLGHTQTVSTIAFSADGRLMVTGGRGTTNVWDTRRWEPVARLESAGKFPFVSLSTSGKYVAALATDLSAQVWTLDVNDLLASACERVTRELTAAEWRMYFGSEAPRLACPQQH